MAEHEPVRAAQATAGEAADQELVGTTTPAFDQGETKQEEDRRLVAAAEIPVGASMFVPLPGVSPFQDRLAAANEAARATSLAALAEWFPGYDFAASAQNVDDRRFTVVVIGGALVEKLAAPDAIDRLLFEY